VTQYAILESVKFLLREAATKIELAKATGISEQAAGLQVNAMHRAGLIRIIGRKITSRYGRTAKVYAWQDPYDPKQDTPNRFI